ncbi:MAG: hypothetical protein IJ106_11055 [Parasporobacterium sp.]|nr:hypothetical protein [Parasporobacterium sp.]
MERTDPNGKGRAYLPASLMDNAVLTARWKKLEKEVLSIPWHDESTVLFDTAGDETLLKILHWSEQLALSMRQLLSDRKTEPSMEIQARNGTPQSGILSENPVRLKVRDGLIRFFAPLTLLRSASESWFLATMMEEVIREYEKENGRIRDRVQKPVYIIVRRNATAIKNGYRDNENLETTKLINMAFRALGFSDGPKNAGYVSLFRLADRPEACGTEIMILEQKKLADHIDLLFF